MALRCSSCGTDVIAKSNFVKFPCPGCGEETIVRCAHCKDGSNPYSCKKCGFQGP